ncbi:receptor expression-enhancing protein 5-like [Anneissia japonica]|uniref:receptor expression-enhancing protein 5-like n=1 Tax=Anneissia japonica TaxID=1529436 RepID=UPI0014257A74|nr:receptor expression-enhancing protein 5-like [Anneissia japonica]
MSNIVEDIKAKVNAQPPWLKITIIVVAVSLLLYLLFGYPVLRVIIYYPIGIVLCLVTYLYPTYASLRVIKSGNIKTNEITQWVVFWIVLGLYSVFEFFIVTNSAFGIIEYLLQCLLAWFPLYYFCSHNTMSTKSCVLLWCMAPIESNGGIILYDKLLFPLLAKHEKEIEKNFDKVRDLLTTKRKPDAETHSD